jgi:hypothetical protein
MALVALVALPAPTRAAGYVGGGGHGAAFRGGYAYGGGWRGYGYRGWGWGWGWGGLGYGLFFAGLPFYYSTLWWDGVPYYYAAGDYYIWNGAVGQYETVRPPPGLVGQAAPPPPSAANLFVYPKNGQSADQQARDRFECHRWAAEQSGFDPTQSGSLAATDAAKPDAPNATPPPGMAPAPGMAPPPGKRQDYLRAQTACLEGRGYSVR